MLMRRSIAALAIAGGVACNTQIPLTKLVEARRIAGDLHVQFTKAADAGNRSVMADTDDEAQVAANEAKQAADVVQRDVEGLKPLLTSLGYGDERRFLDTFIERFDEFRKLDDEVLPLAVENSNLKAQRLSFGAARDAAEAFRAAVDQVARAAPATSAARADALAAHAILSIRDIQLLQGPHIAEASDDVMTKLEGQMMAAESNARRVLDELTSVAGPAGLAHVATATAALEQFMAVNREIVTLSRRNSEVRSLALSLGRKRMVTALCDDQLRGLEDALAKHAISATR